MGNDDKVKNTLKNEMIFHFMFELLLSEEGLLQLAMDFKQCHQSPRTHGKRPKITSRARTFKCPCPEEKFPALCPHLSTRTRGDTSM